MKANPSREMNPWNRNFTNDIDRPDNLTLPHKRFVVKKFPRTRYSFLPISKGRANPISRLNIGADISRMLNWYQYITCVLLTDTTQISCHNHSWFFCLISKREHAQVLYLWQYWLEIRKNRIGTSLQLAHPVPVNTLCLYFNCVFWFPYMAPFSFNPSSWFALNLCF